MCAPPRLIESPGCSRRDAYCRQIASSISGVGRYILTAIDKRDLPAIQGGILFLSLVFVLVNLITDLCYAAADPRVAHDRS